MKPAQVKHFGCTVNTEFFWLLAKQDSYGPTLPDIPHEVDEDDVCMKIVNLIKEEESLGATIKLNERTGAVLVARVLHGGAADRSTAIDVGDEIQEINGVPVRGRDPMEVIRMLVSYFLCINLHVRTLFSYSPKSDSLIPCPQAGLAFLRGEILRLANTDDPNWWQAVKVEFAPNGPVSSLLTSTAPQAGLGKTGLIPSKALKEWYV
ncbi:unnamed protein product [Echinostoma caproni]|uniref:PDZ domain-containing protein n=1 Tax=Echinostoma caproni TaxID=27848 RepID=A0A3P8KCW2_9TREM|nr:unnamed protein product [Echinostoma caproni]